MCHNSLPEEISPVHEHIHWERILGSSNWISFWLCLSTSLLILLSFPCKESSKFHYYLFHFTFTWCPYLPFHWENKYGQKSMVRRVHLPTINSTNLLSFVPIYLAYPLLHDILSLFLSKKTLVVCTTSHLYLAYLRIVMLYLSSTFLQDHYK